MDEIKEILKDFGQRSAHTYFSTPRDVPRNLALRILQNQEIRQFDHYPPELKVNDIVRRGRDWDIFDSSDVVDLISRFQCSGRVVGFVESDGCFVCSNSVLIQWDNYHNNDDLGSTSVPTSNPQDLSESPQHRITNHEFGSNQPQQATAAMITRRQFLRQHSQRCPNRISSTSSNDGLCRFYYKAKGYWRKRSLPLYVCDPNNLDKIPIDCENITFIEGRSNDGTEIKILKMLSDLYIFQNSHDGMDYDVGDEVLKEYIIGLNWNFYDCKIFFGIGYDRFARILQEDQRVSISRPRHGGGQLSFQANQRREVVLRLFFRYSLRCLADSNENQMEGAYHVVIEFKPNFMEWSSISDVHSDYLIFHIKSGWGYMNCYTVDTFAKKLQGYPEICEIIERNKQAGGGGGI